MKKIILITILLISFLIIFLNINSKENKREKIEKNNISIILETEEGNIESNTFPSKNDYEYSNIVCENINDEFVPTFNSETWKLNLSVEKDSIDGNFNCTVHFKEKEQELVEDGLILRYDAYVKPEGNVWKDLSGNNNDGVLYNFNDSNGWNEDNYIYFDGTNYIMSKNNIGLSGDASLSMCATAMWVGETWEAGWNGNVPWSSYVGINSTSINHFAGIALNYGRISMDFWNNRYVSNAVLEINKAYYICVTKTPGNISTTSKIYLNGVEIPGTGNTTISPAIIDSQAVVGRLDANRYSVSRIMEVQIYNKALNQEEVNYNYIKAKSRYNF